MIGIESGKTHKHFLAAEIMKTRSYFESRAFWVRQWGQLEGSEDRRILAKPGLGIREREPS
jgi:hypothetical protein